MDDFLKLVIAFTDAAHGEQLRRYTPDRYIVHPVRVMNICRELTNDPTILAAALMHDILEDTPVSEDDLKEFLSQYLDQEKTQRAVSIVVELTDVYIKKNYPSLNRAGRKQKEVDRLAKCSAEAQTIKCADIIDNAQDMVEYDPGFCLRYLTEAEALLLRLDKADKNLRERASTVVRDGMRKIRSSGFTERERK